MCVSVSVTVSMYMYYLSCRREGCGLQDADGFLQQVDDVETLGPQLLSSLQQQMYKCHTMNSLFLSVYVYVRTRAMGH